MFGAFGFAQAYFAGVLAIIRSHAAGVGGSGFSPNWAPMMEQALEDEDERRRREREEAEVLDLIASGLLL